MVKKIVVLMACVAVFSAAQAQQFEAAGSPAAKQKRAQRFDRGLAFDTKNPIIPKGLWVVGLNGSYSQHDNSDYNLLIINDFNSKGHTINVGPMVHYVFAHNQSIGVRFKYQRSWFKLDSVDINLGSLTDSDDPLIDRYEYLSHTYMGYLSYRYYVALGNSKRFVLFNEIQAGFGGGQHKEKSGTNDAGDDYKKGVYQKSTNIKIGFVPGMTVFISNNVAAEVSIGLLSYNWQKMTQTGTEVAENAGRKHSSISTKFDFLSLSFGMTFYL